MRKLILLGLFLPLMTGATVRYGADNRIVRPFGMWESRQPPPRRSAVVVATPKIDFKAQQVCGYNYLSTASSYLPKEVLTADY
ncbi:MAG: hypothetical protein OXT67_02130, partial [Zetaproteobacteria bacterium]|nr:hypothetical protein [Zetaproteobacteria bacterium]